jgi:acetyl-CoA carboxylase carboxyltransferase component
MMVEQFTGVAIDKAELGSAAMMSSHAGVGAVVVPCRRDAVDAVGELLAYFPDSASVAPPRHDRHDPADRLCPELADVLPESSSGGYDVRRVAESIVDDGSLYEVRSGWATNVVTAFATIDGRPIGVIANQPIALAGTLDILASQKAARFVNTCDAFGLGLLTLVDTPGFYPGKDLEWRGMIRHGAQLVYAYGQATVPRVCVVLRKSYGGAYIVMDSKTMGNDVCLAWPWSELAVMGAGQAAAILRRGADPDETAAFIEDYSERLLNPYVAAERGFVDDVIEPHETRQRVAAAFEMLATKREALPRRRHGNSPL